MAYKKNLNVISFGIKNESLRVDGLCVRVGSMRSHASALTIKLKAPLDIGEVEDLITSDSKWVNFVANNKKDSVELLTPVNASGKDVVFIGRLRQLSVDPHFITAFTVGDQLIWGAAEPLRRMLGIIKDYELNGKVKNLNLLLRAYKKSKLPEKGIKLCILGAGKGTRNKGVDGLHKALLPIENKPVISHVLDNFDDRVEVVLALGYEGEQIKSYLSDVYPNKKITYVDVDNYDGSGSGPGYSLLCCKSELQQPFIYTTVDTILTDWNYDDAFTFVSENWIGASDVRVEESSNYCLIKSKDGYLEDLYYGKGTSAYVGIAGVVEYDKFWSSLENKENGHFVHKDDLHEYQADSGFRGLSQVKVIDFKWYDTGNTKSYNEVRKVFNKEVVANKSDEALFIDNNKKNLLFLEF